MAEFKEHESIKCDCGNIYFEVIIAEKSKLLFRCKCKKIIELDVIPNLDSITKMISGILSDKAKAGIAELLMNLNREK